MKPALQKCAIIHSGDWAESHCVKEPLVILGSAWLLQLHSISSGSCSLTAWLTHHRPANLEHVKRVELGIYRSYIYMNPNLMADTRSLSSLRQKSRKAAPRTYRSYAHQSIKHHQSCEVSKNLLPKLAQDVYLAEWGSKSSSDSVFLCFIVGILLFWSVLRTRFWHHRHLVCNKTAWFLQRATKNVFGKDIKNIWLQWIRFEKCAFIQ